MSTPLVDRFRFMARVGQQTKTPIRAEAPGVKTADGTAVLRLYDPIDPDGGFWGVSGKEFAAVLDDLKDDVETIELHINSPGGAAWDGLAMMNVLRQHPARVVAIVDGIAASAASIVMLGADEVVVAEGAEVMVHNAWGLVVGNASVMQKMAAHLEHLDRNLAGLYAAKAGGTADDWLAVMAEETWYTAQEAVAAGLADRVLAPAKDGDTSAAKARFDLSVFAHAGRSHAPAPRTPVASPASGQPAQRGAGMDPAQIREALGLTADASDEDVVVAATEFREAAARAQTVPPKAATLPEGVVTIDAGVLAALRSDAAAGAEARRQQQADARAALVNAAVRDGRIAPAKAEAWTKRLAADPTEAETLAALEPGLVPLAEIGHSDDREVDALDAELAAHGFTNLLGQKGA